MTEPRSENRRSRFATGWRADRRWQVGFLLGSAIGAAATVLGRRAERIARRGLVDWGTVERVAIRRADKTCQVRKTTAPLPVVVVLDEFVDGGIGCQETQYVTAPLALEAPGIGIENLERGVQFPRFPLRIARQDLEGDGVGFKLNYRWPRR